MIEFVTLLLGLIVGPRPVELVVDESVAAVELHLDGRLVARLDAPPWAAEVDFGTDLEPHRLVARAFDASGRPLRQVRKLVNYSRSDYEAVLVLDPVTDTGPRSGRVIWQAVLDRDPTRLEARFDGRPLTVDPAGRFRLPPHDSTVTHVVEAELTFEDGRIVVAEMMFGGPHGDRVTSALTAVPVTSPHKRPWQPAEVAGWLERDGEPLPVFTAKAEAGTLLLLKDGDMSSDLRWLSTQTRNRGLSRYLGPKPSYEVIAISPWPVASHQGTFQLRRLAPSDLARGVGPVLITARTLVGPDPSKRKRRKSGPQKIWDSLAVAAVHAAASNRPRAALLMIGDGAKQEGSFISRDQAVHFLASVRVPLFVWALSGKDLQGLELPESARTWSGPSGLEVMIAHIAAELESQTIIWLEGEYLPSEVSLGAAAPEGVELVR